MRIRSWRKRTKKEVKQDNEGQGTKRMYRRRQKRPRKQNER